MNETVFNKVWALEAPPKVGRIKDRHTGTLTLSSAGFRYVSPKLTREVPVGQFGIGGFGAAGSDLVNSWVRVVYRDPMGLEHELYFNDGRYFGWGGIFGGADKIRDAIAHAQNSRWGNTP